MNDNLHPFPRTDKPTNATSSAPASSLGSSNSYDGDDARRFFQEWRVAEDHYSEVIRNNDQLEIRLGVLQAALNAAKEEASAIRARLAESDATVAGKTKSMNTPDCQFNVYCPPGLRCITSKILKHHVSLHQISWSFAKFTKSGVRHKIDRSTSVH